MSYQFPVVKNGFLFAKIVPEKTSGSFATKKNTAVKEAIVHTSSNSEYPVGATVWFVEEYVQLTLGDEAVTCVEEVKIIAVQTQE